MLFRKLKSAEDIISLVKETGFLPFFKNGIEGFSVEECTPRELWFTEADGPWEWKGPIARSGECVYGKFFRGKAGFVSLDMFPDLANYRRDGYDFDARYDDGLAALKDKTVYDVIDQNGEILSKKIKSLLNYKKDGNKGFDSIITRLQMQTYINVADFVYMRDKNGAQYGWGVAVYTTPEHSFGKLAASAYRTDPSKSKELVIKRLREVLPRADECEILRLIK